MPVPANAIIEFRGEFDFLSNFYRSHVIYQGVIFPTVEHAFQAAKTQDRSLRVYIASLPSPGKARTAGRSGLIHDFNQEAWDKIKESVMMTLCMTKFSNYAMEKKLLDTGDRYLIEGNRWGDTYWGVDLSTMKGKNHLGRILMRIRKDFRLCRTFGGVPF